MNRPLRALGCKSVIRARSSALFLAFTTLGAAVEVAAQGANHPGEGNREACAVTTVRESRSALDDSSVLYVEPSTVLADGDDLLILGMPTYLTITGRDGTVRQVRDSVFGARRVGRRRWTSVPHPEPGRHFMSIRAARRAADSWDVIFVELPAPFDPMTSDSTIGLWYGVLSGSRWQSLVRVPLPDSIQPGILSMTRLLRTGGTLRIAMRAGIRRARAADVSLILEQRRGEWSWRVLRERDTWLELRHDAQGNARLLRAKWDDAAKPKAVEGLWLLDPTNEDRVLDFKEAQQSGYQSAVASGATGFLATFARPFDPSDRRWYSLQLLGEGSPRALDTIDSAYKRLTVLRGFGSGVGPMWIADHRTSNSSAAHLDLLAMRGGAIRTFASINNPFVSPSPAQLTNQGEVLLVGPAFEETPSGRVLHTLVVSVGVRCRESPIPGTNRRFNRR